jgi:hypothetical protein
MKIKIDFDPHYINFAPVVDIYTDQGKANIEIRSAGQYDLELPANSNDTLCIEFTNKSSSEDNWIEIKKIVLDDIDLQHFIFNGKFWPRYNTDWLQQQDPKPPTFYCPGTHMRHEGVWQLPVKLPIYRTVLDFWIDDER